MGLPNFEHQQQSPVKPESLSQRQIFGSGSRNYSEGRHRRDHQFAPHARETLTITFTKRQGRRECSLVDFVQRQDSGILNSQIEAYLVKQVHDILFEGAEGTIYSTVPFYNVDRTYANLLSFQPALSSKLLAKCICTCVMEMDNLELNCWDECLFALLHSLKLHPRWPDLFWDMALVAPEIIKGSHRNDKNKLTLFLANLYLGDDSKMMSFLMCNSLICGQVRAVRIFLEWEQKWPDALLGNNFISRCIYYCCCKLLKQSFHDLPHKISRKDCNLAELLPKLASRFDEAKSDAPIAALLISTASKAAFRSVVDEMFAMAKSYAQNMEAAKTAVMTLGLIGHYNPHDEFYLASGKGRIINLMRHSATPEALVETCAAALIMITGPEYKKLVGKVFCNFSTSKVSDNFLDALKEWSLKNIPPRLLHSTWDDRELCKLLEKDANDRTLQYVFDADEMMERFMKQFSNGNGNYQYPTHQQYPREMVSSQDTAVNTEPQRKRPASSESTSNDEPNHKKKKDLNDQVNENNKFSGNKPETDREIPPEIEGNDGESYCEEDFGSSCDSDREYEEDEKEDFSEEEFVSDEESDYNCKAVTVTGNLESNKEDEEESYLMEDRDESDNSVEQKNQSLADFLVQPTASNAYSQESVDQKVARAVGNRFYHNCSHIDIDEIKKRICKISPVPTSRQLAKSLVCVNFINNKKWKFWIKWPLLSLIDMLPQSAWPDLEKAFLAEIVDAITSKSNVTKTAEARRLGQVAAWFCLHPREKSSLMTAVMWQIQCRGGPNVIGSCLGILEVWPNFLEEKTQLKRWMLALVEKKIKDGDDYLSGPHVQLILKMLNLQSQLQPVRNELLRDLVLSEKSAKYCTTFMTCTNRVTFNQVVKILALLARYPNQSTAITAISCIALIGHNLLNGNHKGVNLDPLIGILENLASHNIPETVMENVAMALVALIGAKDLPRLRKALQRIDADLVSLQFRNTLKAWSLRNLAPNVEAANDAQEQDEQIVRGSEDNFFFENILGAMANDLDADN
ncbi:uncharacterized protein LOC132193739 isoform X2 [Neocloeon triangulifer]|uniref:uncharacterized protein LOC132193739 isoform X2 n=1 Tax=Neocloeon triangulifer TaxID=2078957 RepID=UPI00286FAAA6|nr:uncharacterized protein LOC132193739 isoform X2 [Neocloeon triangulifer]